MARVVVCAVGASRYGADRMNSRGAIGAVLVVDDNAENRALAKATLEDEGVRVALAASGEAGLAAFERERPDCVLLDIRMPGIDGITVCERMRAMAGGDAVAIVFVTAQRDVETFDRAVRAGGDDFITKPFRVGELVLRIEAAQRLRRLARERGELAADLKRQRDELQRLQLHKERLAEFLVHDLKNPVHTIALQAQRILRNAAVDERSRDAAAKIHDETRSLLRMITNLLDIGKADEGQLAPSRQSVEVDALIRAVIDELDARAAAVGVRLVADVETTTVDVDPDLMHRVLVNLVDNAIRHAPEGTAIRVSAIRGGAATEFRVADAGPGIPSAQRDRVFERFVSDADGDTRTNRGLGLAFCKLAVGAHGGEIWIEDALPGTAFCIRIRDAG